AIVEQPDREQIEMLAYTRRADELVRLRDLPATPVRAVVEYAERAQADAIGKPSDSGGGAAAPPPPPPDPPPPPPRASPPGAPSRAAPRSPPETPRRRRAPPRNPAGCRCCRTGRDHAARGNATANRDHARSGRVAARKPACERTSPPAKRSQTCHGGERCR